MPRFSVATAARRVRGHLRARPGSALTRSFHDHEAVAVEDRSPGHRRSVIDGHAARDPRVVPAHRSVTNP